MWKKSKSKMKKSKSTKTFPIWKILSTILLIQMSLLLILKEWSLSKQVENMNKSKYETEEDPNKKMLILD